MRGRRGGRGGLVHMGSGLGMRLPKCKQPIQEAVALYQYLHPVNDASNLPDLRVPLSKTMPSSSIASVNSEVKILLETGNMQSYLWSRTQSSCNDLLFRTVGGVVR